MTKILPKFRIIGKTYGIRDELSSMGWEFNEVDSSWKKECQREELDVGHLMAMSEGKITIEYLNRGTNMWEIFDPSTQAEFKEWYAKL